MMTPVIMKMAYVLCLGVSKDYESRFSADLNAANERGLYPPAAIKNQQTLCIAYHLILVLLHLALLGVGLYPHAEHSIIFPISLQGRMTSLVTAVAMGLGTV
jgi:hypothetical protein